MPRWINIRTAAKPNLEDPVKARTATSVLLAVGVLLGTSACNFFVPQSTTEHYIASDGMDATVGDLAIRNAVLITADGVSANLVVTVVNNAAAAENLDIQITSGSSKMTKTVQVPGNKTTVFAGAGTQEITFDNVNATAGSLMPVYFQYGDAEGQDVLVPVLNNSMQEYSTLGPTPTPTPAPTVTLAPEPSSTPESTETPTP